MQRLRCRYNGSGCLLKLTHRVMDEWSHAEYESKAKEKPPRICRVLATLPRTEIRLDSSLRRVGYSRISIHRAKYCHPRCPPASLKVKLSYMSVGPMELTLTAQISP